MKPSHSLLGLVMAGPLFLGSSLLFASAAHAAECKVDGDCGEDYRCQIISVPSSPPCLPGGECAPPEQPEPEGVCVKKPITCETDADCPSYLKCESESTDVGCSSPGCPDGNCGEQPIECTPATPSDAPKSCRPRMIKCEVDSECPSNFECKAHAISGCAGSSAPCAAGEECPPAQDECETIEHKACLPKLIECESDAACPSDWACTSFKELSGDCLNTPDVDDGSSEPSPGVPAASCETVQRSLCVPPGYEDGYDDSYSSDNGSAPTAEAGEKDNSSASSGPDAGASSSDDSGCSVAHVGSTRSGSALLTMLGLGFIARLAGRRSRRA